MPRRPGKREIRKAANVAAKVIQRRLRDQISRYDGTPGQSKRLGAPRVGDPKGDEQPPKAPKK